MTAPIKKKLINSFLILKNSPANKYLILFLALFWTTVAVNVEASSQGEKLFTSYCANCHGQQGEGFLKLYPPIQNSRFLSQNVNDLPCIIRYGQKGEIQIGDHVFNQVMPGNEKLSSAEIRLIIHYMQMSWNHKIIELNIEERLTKCH